MGASGHKNGAASAATETTPTIGQCRIPVCLQRSSGKVESCGAEPTHDTGVRQCPLSQGRRVR